MKCYYHHDRDAFGICQTCGKGLCLDCMELRNNTVICKNSQPCALKSDLMNKAYGQIKNSSGLNICMGIFFIILGTLMFLSTIPNIINIFGLIALIFWIVGILFIRTGLTKKAN